MKTFNLPPRYAGWLFICMALLVAGGLALLLTPLLPVDEPGAGTAGLADAPAADFSGRPVQTLYQLAAQGSQPGGDGWTFEAHRRAGDAAYTLGDHPAAAAHWQAALRLRPDDLNLLRRLAAQYLNLGQWTPAVDTLRGLVRVAPDEPWGHFHLGMILAPTSPAEALEHLRLAGTDAGYARLVEPVVLTLTDTPDTDTALSVGLALLETGQLHYAEHAFTQAVSRTPNAGIPVAYLALVREQQGKSGAAWLTTALRLEPENPVVHYVTGLFYRVRRDFPASADAFTLALTFDPLNPAYYAELGTTYWQQGDLLAAEYWLKRAADVSGNEPDFRDLLERFYTEQAPLLAAAGVDAPQVVTANAGRLADQAWGLYEADEVTEALRLLDAALTLDAVNPRALYYKAQLLIAQGDSATARTLLELVANTGADFAGEAQAQLATLPASTPGTEPGTG